MLSMVKITLLHALGIMFITSSEQTDVLKISVFYETYCPDSVNFIMNQLAPMMGEFNKYPDWLMLDLLPFGFEKETSKYKFTCQHGPQECLGNKMNACAIDQLVTKQTKPLYLRLVNFIYCTMYSEDQIKAAHKCAGETEVDFKQLSSCYKGKEGAELMEFYKNRTASLTPTLSWVPTVIFNDIYNKTESDEAQKNLYKVVCRYKPEACT